MPKIRPILLLLLFSNLFFQPAQAQKTPYSHLISPPPQKVAYLPGTFSLSSTVHINGMDALDQTARDSLYALFAKHQIKIISQPVSSSLNLVINKFEALPHPEGYILHLEQKPGSSAQIILKGQTSAGFYYGIQTLTQLFAKSVNQNLHIEDYPSLPTRGIVEGFYGTPWSHAERLQQFAFYGSQKINTYIYAPKDDPYHREKWREPYPDTELSQLAALWNAAKDHHVNFIFAISPGMDLHFDGPAGEADYKAMIAKIDSLYQLGIRQFAIFFDDIENKDGLKQARFLNALHQTLSRTKPDLMPLLTVPTEYFSADMFTEDGMLKPYTSEFSAAIDPSIEVLYTGPGVVCPAIPIEDIRQISELYRRKMQIWWNYPANDYMPHKLALGPIVGMPKQLAAYSAALLMNPMEQADLSKITVQTGASFAWNIDAYDPQDAWEAALKDQFHALAPAMRIFAVHSSHMENSWANAGRLDAPALQETMRLFQEKVAAGEMPLSEISTLERSFSAMKAASELLERQLPAHQKQSCKAQLRQFAALAECANSALAMVKARLAGKHEEAKSRLEQTKKQFAFIQKRQMPLSEKAAMQFIEQSLVWEETF